ncbi:photosynthetic NDH subunit of lumenal location 1 chloroplastic [Prunus yedoensis var. nudiflora]|uniref:Photosynthetic NDH subunit of lumenal location 1 chloroplastic n=1 Tax=Prunus yedoensis var. nudiflora TaxID=2094558 RepID=A0A314ZGK1_PRUYE|nr:photosynthetic NDH subunit of lumenal location 1 chloroplastic [Prunus yedoensis var. nudiflora]
MWSKRVERGISLKASLFMSSTIRIVLLGVRTVRSPKSNRIMESTNSLWCSSVHSIASTLLLLCVCGLLWPLQEKAATLRSGALTTSLLQASSLFAEEIPEKYRAFVDKEDGYSYYYPYDWRDFDFRAHDSAFKDRYMQLHNVRVRFLPTNKTDIHELGPMEEVVSDLVRYKLASPNQYATIFGMQERNIDGKNYYTVEYGLQTPNFATNSFATVAIGNGRFYTLIVVANERRWKRYRNQLKVVADSFRMLDI